MATENTGPERVTFGRGYSVWIMGIDGTWRRNCVLKAVSANDAELTLDGSIEGLNLKEFFLLLSSTGLAYRRCELIRVNGSEIDVRFLKAKSKNGKAKRDEQVEV
ncbi:MAG TPA: PilZ domain-containing protein [Rhodopseudomonas sp.]|uniref:PilZ domain-containing protein n=1 Tax=Rhodopseudomonas sp. TaxID=1078 RepID=UPI002EDAF8F9